MRILFPVIQPTTLPRRRQDWLVRAVAISFSLFLSVLVCGCGYAIGTNQPPGVRSIYVPPFTSDSPRQGLEYQLTEAVQNQIKLRTHYRLASQGNAETILRGHIVEIRKSVLGETRNDDPRELQLGLALGLVWEDARTGRILAQRQVPVSNNQNLHQMESFSDFAPEVGQSMATATQTLVERAAKQAIEMLELPW